MPKPARPRDPNQLAKLVVDVATGDRENDGGPKIETQAARSGRNGGLKGGKARSAKLSSKRRSEIAKKAARARWGSG